MDKIFDDGKWRGSDDLASLGMRIDASVYESAMRTFGALAGDASGFKFEYSNLKSFDVYVRERVFWFGCGSGFDAVLHEPDGKSGGLGKRA